MAPADHCGKSVFFSPASAVLEGKITLDTTPLQLLDFT
jgi:hypothetical protein